jgi:quercetin dioxygenase-like cupin family protein
MENLRKRMATLDADLTALEALGEKLTLGDFVTSRAPERFQLKFKVGGCVLLHIAKKPEYAICEVEVVEKSEMEWHFHEELEIIAVLEGKMMIEYEDGQKFGLEKNDVLVIKSHVTHRAIYGQGRNWQLCITIPAAEAFPDAK